VMDANDNDPKFLQQSYDFTIEENLRRGAVVGVIHAADDDSDINAEIRYSLIPSNNSFQINEITGECFFFGAIATIFNLYFSSIPNQVKL
jgi:hypothetical protein